MESEKLRIDKFHEVANSATYHLSLITYRSRKGQVALYLIAALVAICVLMLMNVGIYLSVSAKNKAMNAGDAAALAAANYQGELLNRIGQMNIDHLKAALEDDEDACVQIMAQQLRACFLGPIDALSVGGGFLHVYGCISAGNEAARENGAERNEDMAQTLRDIARGIREVYAQDLEQYPEPWDGAWLEYALKLENAANAGIWAGPDNVYLPDVNCRHILLHQPFYNAVLGECWCWFKFHNAAGYLDTWNGFYDWPPLPRPYDANERIRTVNSPVYPLHLKPFVGSAVSLLGTNLIRRLTGATEADIASSHMINNAEQQWMFYNSAAWRCWWEIDPYGEWRAPVVGQVKPEYNVRGCAAVCRTNCSVADLVGEEGNDGAWWSAAAKPFGTVENEYGEIVDVTALKGFVVPAFDAVRLVPLDSVVGGCGEITDSANPKWMQHIRTHLPKYLQTGNLMPAWLDGCWYCQQLVMWGRNAFRRKGSRWLKYHSTECVRPESGPRDYHGRYAH